MSFRYTMVSTHGPVQVTLGAGIYNGVNYEFV